MHTMFSLLNTKCAKHGIEKIRTIGDGYLATAGVFTDYSLMHPTAKESILEEIIRRSLPAETCGANHGAPSNITNGIDEVRGHLIQAYCVNMFLFALEAITESKESDMTLRVGLHRGGGCCRGLSARGETYPPTPRPPPAYKVYVG
jgi:class 3 adenylate cyclase